MMPNIELKPCPFCGADESFLTTIIVGTEICFVKCSVCGEILVAQETVDALGHSMTKTAAQAATCTATGNNEYYTCEICGKVF